MKKVATIAGSDATGGGGLQADLKTFQEYGVFGLAAITSIVSLNPEDGSHHFRVLPEEWLEEQLKSTFAGPIDSVKTGLLPTRESIQLAVDSLPADCPLIADPVISGKNTKDFIKSDQVNALQKLLLPRALITTPNLNEAGILSELGTLEDEHAMEQAAKKIALLGPEYVVIKGGARLGESQTVDLLYDGQTFTRFAHPVFETQYNHGAGCTFAAAITAAIAKGATVEGAVRQAVAFVQAAIQMGEAINPYVGHVWHGAYTHAEKRMETPHDK